MPCVPEKKQPFSTFFMKTAVFLFAFGVKFLSFYNYHFMIIIL